MIPSQIMSQKMPGRTAIVQARRDLVEWLFIWNAEQGSSYYTLRGQKHADFLRAIETRSVSEERGWVPRLRFGFRSFPPVCSIYAARWLESRL